MTKNDKTFEENLLELENIVKELEAGNVDLDKAIAKYSEAMQLAKVCGDKLNNAKESINKILTENNTLEDFSIDENKNSRTLNCGKKTTVFSFPNISTIILVKEIILLMVKCMKNINKKIIAFLLLWLMPLMVLAYSNEVILGGQNVGISINSKGVLVVGFYKVNNIYNASRLLIGDYIIKVNNEEIKNIKELVSKIEEYATDNQVEITYLRNEKEYTTKLKLEKTNGSYKTGIYVKDNLLGNGTLTYIDPETKIYGALGHYIIDSNTNEAIKISDGSIFKSVITNITKSTDGNPGSINTKFYRQNVYGTITQNTNSGIFGTYNNIPNDNKTIPVAKIDEVKLGKATIYTSLYQGETKEYTINILKIDKNSAIKNIYFEINDENLIKDAGGIVQGMSGSPIVQNGKLIGAVTHVTIDNVKTGYGISIINMLEQGEKGSN